MAISIRTGSRGCTAFAAALALALLLAPDASARVSRDDSASSTDLGGGSPGTAQVPQVVFTGSPVVGRPFRLQVESAAANAPGLMGFSVTQVPVPLPEFDAIVHPGLPLFRLKSFVTDSGGATPVGLGLPTVGSEYLGVEFVVQAFVADPLALGGLAFSDARRIRLGEVPEAPLLPLPVSRTGGRVYDVVSAQFDGDEHMDLLVSIYLQDRVLAMSGRGDGTFETLAEFTFPMSPLASKEILAQDFDGDGNDDVLVLANGLGYLYLNDGQGGFGLEQVVQVGGVGFAAAAADLDGDGLLDLVVANSSTVSVPRGHGDGTFGLPFAYAVGANPTSIAVADFDSDGDQDLVVANSGSDDITILFNDGASVFLQSLTLPARNTPEEVRTADVDGDGLLDIVLVHHNDLFASVWLSDGVGGFSERIDSPAGLDVCALLDIDGDGQLDLLTRSGTSPFAVELLYGDGAGSFGDSEIRSVGAAAFVSAVEDFDLDGRLDVAIGTRAGGQSADGYEVMTLMGRSEDAFLALDPLPELDARPRDAAGGDLDGDGHQDLVLLLEDLDDVGLTILRGDGTGALVEWNTIGPGSNLREIALRDVDQDGVLDIVGAGWSSDDVRVFIGTGDGTFAAPLLLPGGDSVIGIAVGDIDGDGIVDIANSAEDDDQVRVHLGLGGGAFAAPLVWPVASEPVDVHLEDLDGDGVCELLVLCAGASVLEVHEFGVGGSTLVQSTAVLPDSTRIFTEDLDGDGAMDVAVRAWELVSLHANTGSGVLALGFQVPLGTGDGPIAIVDVDGDGLRDLVASDGMLSSQFPRLVVRMQTPGQGFAPGRFYACGKNMNIVVAVDLDSDGIADIVTLSRNEEIGYVLRGALLR
ncbi:FG-GAP repeat protein [Planctomycetes bacterium Pla163]|uniref:FG-GAP repeat protein n=1 Tax=Rohdeia mirabilis TaxID=2528008 RepID=A0A518CVC8_9BACT|nr:FG-GAP repeat protein [Planctomycetes bacterium Pla163]